MTKRKYIFHSEQALQECIDGYFKYIAGVSHTEYIPSKKNADELTAQTVWDREPEPATISGLTFYLGFESRQAFDHYELKGRFAKTLKRGRLRVEAEYEKKLHQTASTGAIFALKSMGWNDKAELILPTISGSLKVEIVDNGLPTASSEHEVIP